MRPLCEICEQCKPIGVCALTGIPLSVAYCKTCLEHQAEPWWAVRANIAACGGPEQVYPAYLTTIVFFDGRYMTVEEHLRLKPLTDEELNPPEAVEPCADSPSV